MRRIDDIDQRRRWLALTAACLLALGGCSSGDDDASDDSEPTTTVTLAVTWDGETCTYDGPTELAPGAATIEFVNNSDAEAGTSMARLDDDATFEDFVEYHRPEPELTGPPDFVTPNVASGFADAGDVDTIGTDLGEGEYALVCLQEPPGGSAIGAWVARPGGVTVAD